MVRSAFVVAALGLLMCAAATSDGFGVAPQIATIDGNVTIFLPQGALAMVQWMDGSGAPAGAPLAIMTAADMSAAVGGAQQQFSTQLAAQQTQISAITAALATKASSDALLQTTQNIYALATQYASTAVGAAVQNYTAIIGALSSAVTSAIASTATTFSTAVATSAANTSIAQASIAVAASMYTDARAANVTAALSAQVAATAAGLSAAIATKVDVGALTVIDAEVQTVVTGMVAPNATANALNAQLGTKLTSSPTCSCFDPAALQAVASAVGTLQAGNNYSLYCAAQGLVYNKTSNSCSVSANVNCGNTIAGLPAVASSACGTTPGSTLAGATCVATCNSGFTGGRTATFTCGSNGVWAGSLSCPADQCPTIGAIANGAQSGGTTTGAVVTFTCNSGYALVGETTVTCLVGQTWSAPAPICSPLCPVLAAPGNGTVALPPARLPGHAAEYACNSGYVLDGTQSPICLDSGAWSTPPPQCTVACAYSPPANGYVTAPSNIVTGSQLVFYCNANYYLIGSRTSICNRDGSWSDAFPTCVVVLCPPLIAPGNGTVDNTGNGTVNNVRHFACNAGYVISGPATATCLPTSTWSANASTTSCNPGPCTGSPPAVAGATASISSGVYGSVATYTCSSGYYPSGTSTSTCQSSLTWSTPSFSCTACTAVTGCTGTLTCSSASTSRCSACGSNYAKVTSYAADICCNGCSLLTSYGGWSFYKVPVSGTMSDANIYSTCTGLGMRVPCAGPSGCSYNNNQAQCVITSEIGCGNPMQTTSQNMCGGANPNACAGLNYVFQFMGGVWISGASCGEVNGGWCSVGTSYSNDYTICV